MVFTCPFCNGNIGEESCVGCRRVVISYRCSRCKRDVMNPRYKSGIICGVCGFQVVEARHKIERRHIKHYLCYNCEETVVNPKFTGRSSCENCGPPEGACGCGGELISSLRLNYKKCVKCGIKYDK